jgi:anti-sigma factor RsiW
MTCSDFETIIIEIARDRLMDAATRERGLEHIGRCTPCATLLVEERALSRDLRALSARYAAEEMPERIEAALLAAFRQAPGRTRRSAPTIVAPRRRRWLLAVAALALLTFGISLAAWIASSPKRGAPEIGSTGGVAPPSSGAAPHEKSDQTRQQVTEFMPSDRHILAPRSEKRQKRSANVNRLSASNDSPSEFVTPFFPVMQGGELIPFEGGQVVRVRMPRSNLTQLGIPFNQERASETIKADVLLSNDGLARAIRLVY